MPFKAENDLLQEAVVTTMISDICSILTTFGNADLSFESSSRPSLMELYVFSSFSHILRVFFACVHSATRTS